MYLWVLNDTKSFDRAFRLGTTGIMTDYPTLLQQHMTDRKMTDRNMTDRNMTENMVTDRDMMTGRTDAKEETVKLNQAQNDRVEH